MEATHLLHLLRCKELLSARLRYLGIHDPRVAKWLVDLDRNAAAPATSTPSPSVLETLQQQSIVRSSVETPESPLPADRRRKPSLRYIRAVNFELTYDCNWNCSHCLQQGIRERHSGSWLSVDAGKRALHDAWFAGLASTGVNFTGGEVFLPQSNLPEFVEAARSLPLDVRINTNGWWGKQETVRIGKLEFRSPGRVVGWLREMGVGILALSLDRRYRERPVAWRPVVAIVQECERHRLFYQFVCTGVDWYGEDEAFCRMLRDAGVTFDHLAPMAMVDVGGAAGQVEGHIASETLATAVRRSDCGGSWFYRPWWLHVAPDGGVRTCLYAPGGGWLGNIHRESLLQIVNGFSECPVTGAFCREELAPLAERFVEPYARIYRSVEHPCAASAVLARIIERCYGASDADLRQVHERIAAEMNLRMVEEQ